MVEVEVLEPSLVARGYEITPPEELPPPPPPPPLLAGGVTMAGRVILTFAFKLLEILLEASLAQAYNILEPCEGKVYSVCEIDDQASEIILGVDSDSVIIYPVTETLSLTVNDEMGIVNEFAVLGIVKAVTVGFVASESAAKVTEIVLLVLILLKV